MRIEDISAWEAFQAVAVQGNFSKAAKHLRLGVPQLSKRVSKLEDQLGARLFTRSTRRVALTDEGRSLLPKVTNVLEDLTGLESSFEARQTLSGTIRITAVPFIAHRLLLPAISSFTKLHPNVKFDIDLSEGFVNLLETNRDLALRIHDDPKDTALIYKKLYPNMLTFCASPGYLKKAKAPLKKVSDLKAHDTLVLDIHRKCRFKDGSTVGEFSTSSPIHCDNGWFLTQLALNDFGVLLRARFDVQEYLDKGKLVQVLESHALEPFGHLYAVIPSRRYLSTRVRVFLEFLHRL